MRTAAEIFTAPGPRVLIAAAGTGGHLFPAIAVADALRRRLTDVQIAFVGTGRDVERRIIAKTGYPLIEMSTRPLKGRSLLYRVGSFALILPAIVSSMFLIRRLRPALVIGAGGYVSGPFVLAAAFTTPTLIMEVNLRPGLTTRWLSPFVDRVACSFEESVKQFGKRGVFVGHPVRPEFFDVAVAAPLGGSARPRLLCIGGSQGSAVLNKGLIEALPAIAGRYELVHQTGEAHITAMRDAHGKVRSDAAVMPFIDNVAEQFARADLIISRAGASTIAEIQAAGRPSILVPFAAAADNHQELNARAVERAGAAVVVTERELAGGALARTIDELCGAPERLAAMSAAARRMSNPRSAEDVASIALGLMGHGGADA